MRHGQCQKSQAAASLVLLAAILAAWNMFSPALSGPFFFDDHVNLPQLRGSGSGISSTEEFFRFIFPSHAGGRRPISYMAFLIDDNHWPTHPKAFKRTNLLIHLLNGLLVVVLMRKLIAWTQAQEVPNCQGNMVAVLAGAAWLFHPIHLAPTMMVVQRMTLLGGTFSLLAFLAYVTGRQIAGSNPKLGLFLLFPVFGTLWTFGIFSKESAFLVIGYIAVIELTLANKALTPRPDWWRYWAWLFFAIPLTLFAAYLVAVAGFQSEAYAARPFTAWERMLTEFRVLWDYIYSIAIPSLGQFSAFRDDFPISRSLLSPPSTALAVAATILCIAAAVRFRKIAPLAALAVLWFFVGHILESTVIPLELYFQHRNYLPMLGLYIAATLAAVKLAPSHQKVLALAVGAYLVLLSAVTLQSARVWGDPLALATISPKERPTSTRAHTMAINYWIGAKHGEILRQQLEAAERNLPDNASFPLLRYTLQNCQMSSGVDLGGSLGRVLEATKTARFEFGSIEAIQWLIRDNRIAQCNISNEDLLTIIDAYLDNDAFANRRDTNRALHRLAAEVYKMNRDLHGTVSRLRAAFDAKPSYGGALHIAYILASAGLFDESLEAVDLAEATPTSDPYDWLRKDGEITEYRERLLTLKQERGANPNASFEPIDP